MSQRNSESSPSLVFKMMDALDQCTAPCTGKSDVVGSIWDADISHHCVENMARIVRSNTTIAAENIMQGANLAKTATATTVAEIKPMTSDVDGYKRTAARQVENPAVSNTATPTEVADSTRRRAGKTGSNSLITDNMTSLKRGSTKSRLYWTGCEPNMKQLSRTFDRLYKPIGRISPQKKRQCKQRVVVRRTVKPSKESKSLGTEDASL